MAKTSGPEIGRERHNMKILNLATDDDCVRTVTAIALTMLVGKAFKLLNCPVFYVLFRVLSNVRPRYPSGHLWGIDGKFGSVEDILGPRIHKYMLHTVWNL